MNNTTNKLLPSKNLLIFVKEEFSLNDQAISLAIKHSNIESAPFPIVLWNFGLITVEQYQVLLDWIIDNEYI
jgi:hypothetical protein